MAKKIPEERRSLLFLIKFFFLFLAVMVFVSSSGCLEPYPTAPQQPTPSAEGGNRTEILPTETPLPSETRTLASAGESGYIARSFGLVPYGPDPDYHVTYIDSAAKKDKDGSTYIQGRIKNEGPANLKYLHVTFYLYDANGNVLGNVYATVEYLKSGMIWHYTTNSFPTEYYQYHQVAGLVAQ